MYRCKVMMNPNDSFFRSFRCLWNGVLCAVGAVLFCASADAKRIVQLGQVRWSNTERCSVHLQEKGKPFQLYIRHTGYFSRSGQSLGVWKGWRSKIYTNRSKCLVEQHRKQARIFIRTRYVKGKKHGRWVRIYSHGYKEFGHHFQDRKQGTWKFYTDTGALYQVQRYKKGQKHGKQIDWWVTSVLKGGKSLQKVGRKRSERHYKDGRPTGMSFLWTRKGALHSQAWFERGSIRTLIFHKGSHRCRLEYRKRASIRQVREQVHCNAARPYSRKMLLRLFSRHFKNL